MPTPGVLPGRLVLIWGPAQRAGEEQHVGFEPEAVALLHLRVDLDPLPPEQWLEASPHAGVVAFQKPLQALRVGLDVAAQGLGADPSGGERRPGSP